MSTHRPVLQKTEDSLQFCAPQERVSHSQLFWILQCVGWAAFGTAMYSWGLDFLSPRDALISKSLLVALGLAITLIFRALFRKLRGQSWAAVTAAACLVAVSFAGAALWREIHTLLFQLYYHVLVNGRVSVQFVRIPLGTFLYDGFVLLTWSLLYFAINAHVELEQQRLRVARAEAMAQAARLRALQSQLEPHFLFNTLNAISTLVVEGENPGAAKMIARLSDFLRFTLETTNTAEIPLAEELELARRYLEIEQVRFGSRLRVNMYVEPEAMSGLVPTLVLQPLIENAVKHGVLPHENGGSVWITAERNNGMLHLRVADDGPGLQRDCPADHRLAGQGVGLRNTADRLGELYGGASRFSLGPSSTGGTAVSIEIPFHSASLGMARNGAAGDNR